MSLKLKVLGLGLLAALAVSAIAVVNASASITGHFEQEITRAHLKGEESGTNHRIKFSVDGGTPIECTIATYTGTPVDPLTFEELTVTPHYTECKTEGASEHNVTVHVDGCEFEFYSNKNASTHTPTSYATTGLWCPKDVPGIRVTHPNCTMRMPPQTITTRGVRYTTTEENKKHAITLTADAAGITAHYEAGICIFLGTTHSAVMVGSATVWAVNANNEPVGITAT